MLIDARFREGIGAPLQLYNDAYEARLFLTVDLATKVTFITFVSVGIGK